MLTPLNRAQLAAVFQQDRCQEIVRILDQHNIPSQVRTMDRTSPSVFSMGTRERSGALFQDPRPELAVRHLRGQEGPGNRPCPHRAGWNPVEGQERFNTPYKRSVQRAPGNGCSWGPLWYL